MVETLARRPMPRSLYRQTAPPPPETAALAGDITAQVVIVGGGFTGLSAALHLAEAGVDTVVLEASQIGWGASGRNGGQVNPGLKWEPDELERTFGADLGGRMVRLGDQAPALVFDLIARHGIDCAPRRGGTLRAALSARVAADVRDFQRQWVGRGADVVIAERKEMACLTGTGDYLLGAHDRRGGQVNPLAYCRGLARAAQKAGARLFTGTPATRLARSAGGWELSTPTGLVRAERVILATNGYSDDLWPGLRRSVVPVYSSITATEPLPPDLAAPIMPNGVVLYEMSSSYAYYRLDDAGRFIMGGRSLLRPATAPEDFRALVDHATRLFPVLKAVEWTHRWNGQVAVTRDVLPHLHEPEPGLTIGLGYNGRGVAMATATGRMLARHATGGGREALDLPVTRIRPILGHAAWPLAVKARLKWDRLRETFDR
ncbi:glycine/D-amino acid oxidase-like deaminating enzyme [Ancylobacter aquaticus]|uniref:Glycine/D-amino acid oxidase-like deaminating enzyme n=1 Tax=Ancylobacter aquaticus TaxID=100 RepID=A0A4R1HUL0_ANCAQ|nr:FAD-binding oxidoreductase [Ancylobacter aquaticus]TCK23629.1 glycine/D-amino acid oxidase-like deaminating enzyme [Ancylobacter aquaticus]